MRDCLRLSVTGPVSITGRILWRRYVEQLTRSRDVLGPPAVGEQTVVPDALEAVGQDMNEEAADELIGVERHQLVASAELGPVILPFESHALAVEGDEPAVGNSGAVCVAGQVGEHRLRSAERALAVNDPFGAAPWFQIRSKGMAVGEMDVIAEELEAAGVVGGHQLCQEQAAEQP